jgi:hypothetical protein
MRALEVMVIVVILAAAAGVVFARRDRRLDTVLLSGIGMVGLLHGVIDHLRIQMVPAYAVAVILLVVLLRRLFMPYKHASSSWFKKGLLSIIILGVSGLTVYSSLLLPVFTMPEPTGNYAIGTVSRHLTDESRTETKSADPNAKRELLINVWYPVDQSVAEGKPKEHYPSEVGEAISLVFGIPKQYQADPDFPTSSGLYDYNVEGVGIRVADARFVLDTITEWNTKDPNGLFEGKLDLDRVGIFGHSYGGATTAEALAQDKRFKAGVSLEGGFWGEVAHKGLQQPFLYMLTGGTAKSLDPANTNKDKVFFEEFETDLDSVMTKTTNDTYYLIVDHFIHQSFTEIALLAPSLFAKEMDPVHNIDITRSYVTAFFDQYLKGEHQVLLDGPSAKYPEVAFDDKYTKKSS